MSTRRASKQSTQRQERFASSSALRKGMLGNLVSRRCSVVRSPEDRELIWWLQEITLRAPSGSHFACTSFPAWPRANGENLTETGLERVAMELCAHFPARVIGDAKKAIKLLPGLLAETCLNPHCDLAALKCKCFEGLVAA